MEQPEPDDAAIGVVIARLVDDARAYVRAELDYAGAVVADRLALARRALLFVSIAAVLVIAAAIALVVGLVLALAGLIGAGWATLVVVAVTLAVAALFGWAGVRRFGRATRRP